MENIAPTPIDKLQPYVKVVKIRVRICRIWKYSIPGAVQTYTALHSVLLDGMQHAVEACTSNLDCGIVASKIEAGNCYEIMDFRISRMKGQ
ncbi:hypothetical protein DVH24_001177 [Malus domestica]|uniref:Uncharacterized protein n=1 Tax=Malus domestica TaxID=3750 RepID=A0A498K5J3_MALDO|nr:hypothetical protein DVH24_001177 [Malus domestica]